MRTRGSGFPSSCRLGHLLEVRETGSIEKNGRSRRFDACPPLPLPLRWLVVRCDDRGPMEVEVVVAHSERATLRVGEVFLKVDSDQTRIDVEVAAMRMVPIATPKILWQKPNVLALASLPGRCPCWLWPWCRPRTHPGMVGLAISRRCPLAV